MQIASTYYPVLLFFGVACGFALTIVLASWVLIRQKPDTEKNSPYECGFAPMTPTIQYVDIRFYLISILFVIFDLEMAFLFPWSVSLSGMSAFAFGSVLLFLGVLTVGFIYEWRKGALEWS